MKNKLAGILIGVLYVLSLFAGASASEIHAISVKPFADSTPAPDTIVLSGTESYTWNAGGLTAHTFYVPHGTYEVTVKKAGYETFTYSNLIIGDSTGANTNIYYQLTASAGTEPGTEPSTEPSEPTSTDVAITDVDYQDEVKPNEEMSFDVDLKNNAAYDAENVKLTVTIQSIDDGDDIDATEEFSTLDSKDKDTYSVKLTVPKEVDAKKYSFETKVEWETDDGTEYQNTKLYTDAIEVVKEKHDVQITDASFIASSIEAGKSDQASVSLWNAGKNDETVKIKIEVPDLKISVTSAQFDLDENDESTQYVSFAIPSDAKAGKYYAYATVYFNDGSANNMETLTLEVKGAATTQSDKEVTVTPIVVTTQTETAGKGGFGGLGKTGLIASAVIVLLVLAMLYREYAPQFQPKPVIIKTARGGR